MGGNTISVLRDTPSCVARQSAVWGPCGRTPPFWLDRSIVLGVPPRKKNANSEAELGDASSRVGSRERMIAVLDIVWVCLGGGSVLVPHKTYSARM